MKSLKILGVAASAVVVVALSAGTASADRGFNLVNGWSGLCPGVAGQTGNGAAVTQWGCTGVNDRIWNMVATTDNNGNLAYFVRNVHSGKCMGVGSSLSNGAGAIQWTCNGAVDQKWWYTSGGALRNVYSGKCLGVASSATPGQQLIQWTCNGASDQEWWPN
ncbi:RICIN domain-containing protein [Streptomyces sp. NPDC005953]|uniref:RICIN domain-containing protein n=1 Tax=Streptomyces sp. NPDC005953 TaxID=3156719 RepID=UPI0033CEED23